MKKEEQLTNVKFSVKKKSNKKSEKARQSIESAAGLPGKQDDVAAEMKKREH
jgi:hypothetical protein